MLFNSIPFLLFFLLFSTVYYLISNPKLKTSLLLVGSYFFYAYTGVVNLILILTITVITYTIAKLLKKCSNTRSLLSIGILSVVLVLLGSKYAPVVLEGSPLKFSLNETILNSFIVRFGISFYSLQAISMMVDLYRHTFSGPVTLKNTSLYLAFFPQSASGPFHRMSELIPQFENPAMFLSPNIVNGIKTMLIGYLCKLIVADKISLVISPVFDAWEQFDGLTLVLAAFLYSFQIYFDFWGYSLIAIGVGRVLGFHISTNFDSPYTAVSFKEFWHRWHITLSRWMRDYIYVSLGGRRRGYIRFCIAILVVFFVSGFWHGFTFNFLLWGMIHAGLYLVEDAIERLVPRTELKSRLPGLLIKMILLIRWFVFFTMITFTWLVFKTGNIRDLSEIIGKIFSFNKWSASSMLSYYFGTLNMAYLLIILAAAALVQYFYVRQKRENIPLKGLDTIAESVLVSAGLIAIILFGGIGAQKFLYFNF